MGGSARAEPLAGISVDGFEVRPSAFTPHGRSTGFARPAVVPPARAYRAALGALAEGDPVNLERAATLNTRLGGHLVQGHVDGVGTVTGREPAKHWEVVRIALPPGLSRYVVEKGSITVDGISLTVVAVDDDEFSVSLIPTTLELTTLGRKGVGTPVNLEVDVIAKYVEKLVGARS